MLLTPCGSGGSQLNKGRRKGTGELLLSTSFKNVDQRISIEGIEEGHQRFVEHSFQPANARDRARVAIPVETFDKAQAGLGMPNYIAQADFMGFARELKPSRPAGLNFDISLRRQRLNDSHQMVLGDVVGGTDFLRGDKPVPARAQINQNPQRKIGM